MQAIESGLLEIDVEALDAEAINTIFRAAHSIKGGSATFGFAQVAAYTHVMENLLDQIREGKRAISREIVDVLLQSVDTLTELLTLAQSGDSMDAAAFTAAKAPLDRLLSTEASAGAHASVPASRVPGRTAPGGKESNVGSREAAADPAPQQTGWRIVLTPHPAMMQRGNDPIRLIRELKTLGPVDIECDVSLLPAWTQFEPLNSYLGWAIRLHAVPERSAIEEVFAWVEDECDLALVPVLAEAGSQHGDGAGDRKSMPPAESAPARIVPDTVAAKAAPSAAQSDTDSPGSGPGAQAKKPRAAAESQSIRVDLAKVDTLINMVGELVITQSMLNVLSDDEKLQGMERLQQGLGQLQRQTRALQEGVMQIRMLPISFCFNRFPRMVRDLSQQLNKEIHLELSGENTEVDKTVIEKINDPLVHLVRNSVDHGIEEKEDRVRAGKPEQGTVNLRAYHEVGDIVIEVEDDGKGLNPDVLLDKARRKGLVPENAQLSRVQILELIFLPGFSTKEQATDLSGRGVGMDVVKRNVQSLGGNVTVDSELGRGTRFTIRLPLTLAIMDGQLARIGEEVYVVPLVSIIESLQPGEDMVNLIAGTQETIKLRGQYLPVLRLAEAFGVPLPDSEQTKPLTNGIVVIVEHEHQRFGIFLDDLLSQQQIVIKSLDQNYHTVEGVSGATILGDGRVALILDVASLSRMQRIPEDLANAG